MAFFYNNFKFTSGSSGINLEITLEWLKIYIKNFEYLDLFLFH